MLLGARSVLLNPLLVDSLWLRAEIQAVQRRGDRELNACRSPSASYLLNLEVR